METLCPACGKPLEANAQFCQFCGEPVSGVPAPALVHIEPEPELPEPVQEIPAEMPVLIRKAEKKPVVRVPEKPEPPVPEKPVPAPEPSGGYDVLAPSANPYEEEAGGDRPAESEESAKKKGGKKKPRKSGFPIKYALIAIVILAVLGGAAAVLLSGNSGMGSLSFSAPMPTPTPTPTPEPTVEVPVTEEPTVATPTPTPTLSLEPEATDTFPPGTEVSIVVDPIKSPSDASVMVTFNGGPGMRAISKCNVTLIRSDGEVVSGQLDTTKVGSELTLQGTRGTDRIIVDITQWTGKTYTVIDQTIGYR